MKFDNVNNEYNEFDTFYKAFVKLMIHEYFIINFCHRGVLLGNLTEIMEMGNEIFKFLKHNYRTSFYSEFYSIN